MCKKVDKKIDYGLSIKRFKIIKFLRDGKLNQAEIAKLVDVTEGYISRVKSEYKSYDNYLDTNGELFKHKQHIKRLKD